jgi:cell division protein FtsL
MADRFFPAAPSCVKNASIPQRGNSMAPAPQAISERQQLQEKLWTYAQRAVVLLVAVGVGVFIGFQLWGEAASLRQEVRELRDRVAMREKERDTLKSQMAIVDRDKKELEKRFQDLQSRCGTQLAP